MCFFLYMHMRRRKSDTRPRQRRSCAHKILHHQTEGRESEREVEKRIEEKVGLVALHALFLTVRPKEELKGVVCTLFRFVSFALVSSSFYIDRYECFLFSSLYFLHSSSSTSSSLTTSCHLHWSFYFFFILPHLQHAQIYIKIDRHIRRFPIEKKMCELMMLRGKGIVTEINAISQ